MRRRIVVRKGARPLFAVVQRSKDDRWVLPRGKLKATERARSALAASRRRDRPPRRRAQYLGAITYRARAGRRSCSSGACRRRKPSHDLMKDIAGGRLAALKAAVRRLSYPLEKTVSQSTAGKRSRRAISRANQNQKNQKPRRRTKNGVGSFRRKAATNLNALTFLLRTFNPE